MDWQARYLENDIPWDKGAAAPSLADLLAEDPSLFSGKKFLVPGCGYGHDAALLSQVAQGVVAMDIADAAVDKGNELYGSLPNLTFKLADLFVSPDPSFAGFDGIWEHTCFCAIDPKMRRDYVEAMWRWLKPGGNLIGIFFTNPDVEPGEGPPFGVSVEEVCDVFDGYFELVSNQEPRSHYDGREGRERLLVFTRLEC